MVELESLLAKDDLDQLGLFAKSVWGNPNTVLKKFGDIQFIDLEGYHPVFQQLFPGALSYDKILVREEYHLALKQLEGERYLRGAYVTGQPGIGKTLFNIYVLVARLGRRLAVAVQSPSFYVLFGEEGSVSIHTLQDATPLARFQSQTLWALADSNAHIKIPSHIFLSQKRVRTIQTTSPRESRWKQWSKEARAKGYVMDIWSEKEIGDLAELLKLNSQRMISLAQKLGCVPRIILDFMEDEGDDNHINREYQRHALQGVHKTKEMLSAILNCSYFDDAPSSIFFCQPYIKSGILDRRASRITVPTQYIRIHLGKALQQQDSAMKVNFFNSLRQSSETCQAAGIIFENWFLCFFSMGNAIECNWVQGSGVSKLTGIDTLIPGGWNTMKSQLPPYFWIAPMGFKGIDGALVLKEEIYVFQVTISRKKHKPPTNGMKALYDHLPGELKGLPWKVIFVGDKSISICGVATSVGAIPSPAPGKEKVPIAWSVVDPVRSNIAYKEHRDELASEMESDEVPMGGWG